MCNYKFLKTASKLPRKQLFEILSNSADEAGDITHVLKIKLYYTRFHQSKLTLFFI